MKKQFLVSSIFGLICVTSAVGVEAPTGKTFVNSIGMKFVRLEPGSFAMGFGAEKLADEVVTGAGQFREGDFDEHPTHRVKITRPFYIAACEVTNAQYEQFDRSHRKLRGKSDFSGDDEAVVDVSWYDAVGFCEWLCEKEGRPYRLPTEAEWEYACRAGTTGAYHTGPTLPKEYGKRQARLLAVGQRPPNQWGIYDMHGNVEEWCLDWYGPYEAAEQVDPVGRIDGDFKITRGGSHSTEPYYLRSSNRMGTIPQDKHMLIGFRVVLGEMPAGLPLPKPAKQLYQRNVRQKRPSDIAQGPDPDKAYFHKPREFVKMPKGNRGPLFAKHSHFMSVVECPNDDLLAIWHSCIGESGRELSVAGSRLRYGREDWEPASLFWDAPDRNDHGHALWFDGKDTIYHFQGLATQVRDVALIMRTSSDNGVTWSKARIISGGHGASRMPIESVFRTNEGFYTLVCDKGPTVLWVSRNQGQHWYKSEGHIRGKHATVAQLNDGRLIAFGRERNIDGMMPISISADMGKSWEYSASEFQPVCWGQRSVLLRLKEGPLVFASFCKRMKVTNASGGKHPVSGLFGAVSRDEAKTWPSRRLITDDGPGRDIETMDGHLITMSPYNAESVGYLTVCQSADGVIHLLTSRQHYAFNLEWLLTPPPAAPAETAQPRPRPLSVKKKLAKIYMSWGQQLPSTVGGKDEFAAVSDKRGLTAEISTKVVKVSENECGVNLEIYDGGCGRYAMTITAKGVYWYEGLILGTATLPFDQFTPVAEGLDNSDKVHTYRLAVREDRVAQIYRDGKLVGVRNYEYRTPRDAYIHFNLSKGAEAVVYYVAYDLSGPYQP